MLNLVKGENEESTFEEIVSASLSYLVFIDNVNPQTGKISEFVWTNKICLDREIYSHIK